MYSYEFKHNKSRLLIVGYGDVGKRILEYKDRFAGFYPFKNIFFDHFRVIIVSRNGLENLDFQAYKNFKKKGVVELKLNLDQHQNIKKISKLPTHSIVLIPPKGSLTKNNIEHNDDLRMKKFCTYLKESMNVRGVYISTTGVYGNANGKLIDETYICNPKQSRSKRRLYAEKIFRLTKRFHILRVPGIYAQNRLPLERLKSRKPALVSSDDVYSNHIHADDLARVSYMSLFKGRKKRVTNVVDDSKLKMADYFDLIADFYNLPKPPRVDKNELKKLVEQEVLSTMMASFFQESRRLKNIRLKKELRVSLRFPDVEYFLKKNFNKN